ncbi:ATP-binding protein [Jiangella sp. DSM 45060]|uniref:AAA family ATPase n=1 Tax=Jiangella sp. DSM 45060 TaxID=1798224 RepID=UPI00087C7691|nr:ATP-binding protein [Jiangella sp. DSM 45060]SDT67786.1 ATPase family associated with various cellular activities (AAA) [Jiangella sp. DSM 45060]
MEAEQAPAPADAALRRMPPGVRDALSWLAHVLDATVPLRTAEDHDEFARRQLGGDTAGVVAVRERLGPFTAPLVARVLAEDMRAHPPSDLAGLESDESPRWDRLQLDDTVETVPTSLVAAFEPGTLSAAPLIVAIDARWSDKELIVHARTADVEAAERYLQDVVARARGPRNYFKGRCLHIRARRSGFDVVPVAVPDESRDGVIVPAAVWADIDLNVAGLFRRRDLMQRLGLGTNRGLLLHGPPGTGKSALCRVLAAELAGDVTVVFCDAQSIADAIEAVYEELTRLSPALVVLEDLDLVIGRRRYGNDLGLHGFLAALDGAMSRHQGVVTVATTNDPRVLDDAAVRAARFDRTVELPLPDGTQRRAILRRYLGPLAAAVEVDAIADGTDGASGADLRELVRRSVLADGDEVTTATLRRNAGDGTWAPATGAGLYV